CMQGIQFPFSF
nr:immunoglobulin light chain junction region [Macaca mulatta]